MPRALLRRRAVTHAIVQDCLQFIVGFTTKIGAHIDDDADKLLPHALAHESALAKMEFKALLGSDDADQHLNPLGGPFQTLVAGKRQIVGITTLTSAERADNLVRFPESGEPPPANFKPIEIIGKPLSETILEERR